MGAIKNGELINDAIGKFLGPDPVASAKYEQVHGYNSGTIQDEGLRRLMLAVLRDGIESYQDYLVKPSRRNEARFREVEEWITSDSDNIFSFRSICENLEIDAGWLRKALLSRKEKQHQGVNG